MSKEKEVVESGSNKQAPTVATKAPTDAQIYSSIEKAVLKPKYKKIYEAHKKAIQSPEKGYVAPTITVVSSNLKVDYSEIMRCIPYAIKRYSLYGMFELTESQRKFLLGKKLNYFAQKKIENL